MGITIKHAMPRLEILSNITAVLCQCRENQDPLSAINADLETSSEGEIRVVNISSLGRMKRQPFRNAERNDFIRQIETSVNRMPKDQRKERNIHGDYHQ